MSANNVNNIKSDNSFYMNSELINAALDEFKESRNDLADVDQQLYQAMHDLVYANGSSYVASLDESIDLNQPERLIEVCRDDLDNIVSSMSKNVSFVERYNDLGDYNDTYVNAIANNMTYMSAAPAMVVAEASQQCVYGPAPSYVTEVQVIQSQQCVYGPAPMPEPEVYDSGMTTVVYGPAPVIDEPIYETGYVTLPQCVYGPAPMPEPDIYDPGMTTVVYGPAPVIDEPIYETGFVTLPQCVYGPAPMSEPDIYDPRFSTVLYGAPPMTDPITDPGMTTVVYGPAPVIDEPTYETGFVTLPQCVYGPAPMPEPPIYDHHFTTVLYGAPPISTTTPLPNTVPETTTPQQPTVTEKNVYAKLDPITLPKVGKTEANVVKMNLVDNTLNNQPVNNVSANNQVSYYQEPINYQNNISTSVINNTSNNMYDPVIESSSTIEKLSSDNSSVTATIEKKSVLNGLDTDDTHSNLASSSTSLNEEKIPGSSDRPSNPSSSSNTNSNVTEGGRLKVSAAAIAGIGAVGLAGVAAAGIGANAKKKKDEEDYLNQTSNQYMSYDTNQNKESLDE